VRNAYGADKPNIGIRHFPCALLLPFSLGNLVALDVRRYVIDAGDDVFAVRLFPQRHVSA
jgi:hypothetical protein